MTALGPRMLARIEAILDSSAYAFWLCARGSHAQKSSGVENGIEAHVVLSRVCLRNTHSRPHYHMKRRLWGRECGVLEVVLRIKGTNKLKYNTLPEEMRTSHWVDAHRSFTKQLKSPSEVSLPYSVCDPGLRRTRDCKENCHFNTTPKRPLKWSRFTTKETKGNCFMICGRAHRFFHPWGISKLLVTTTKKWNNDCKFFNENCAVQEFYYTKVKKWYSATKLSFRAYRRNNFRSLEMYASYCEDKWIQQGRWTCFIQSVLDVPEFGLQYKDDFFYLLVLINAFDVSFSIMKAE